MTFDQAMVLTRMVSSATAFDEDECSRFWDLLVQVPKNGLVVEIGSQLGRSSSLILQAGLGRFQSVFIDPWTSQPDYARQWHEMAWNHGPHTVFQMRTDQVLKHSLGPREIDLLLIDGDHTEDGVRKDLGMAGRIKPGGILCAHDFGRFSLPDVYAVISPFVKDGWEDLGIAGTLGCWKRTKPCV